MDSRHIKAEAALKAKATWLERNIQALIMQGAEKDAISIEEHPDLVTVIKVSGVEYARFQIEVTFTGKEVPGNAD